MEVQEIGSNLRTDRFPGKGLDDDEMEAIGFCFLKSPWALPDPKDFPVLLERPRLKGGHFSDIVCKMEAPSKSWTKWSLMDVFCLVSCLCSAASEYFNASSAVDSLETIAVQVSILQVRVDELNKLLPAVKLASTSGLATIVEEPEVPLPTPSTTPKKGKRIMEIEITPRQ
jgi:hypothetical protein